VNIEMNSDKFISASFLASCRYARQRQFDSLERRDRSVTEMKPAGKLT